MFGYVRPYKPELLMRQWTFYQSVYCGLCKQLGRQFGQLPRLSLTYDMTFLVLLLHAFAPDESSTSQVGCILNPLKKKTVVDENPALAFAADITVILAWHKGQDDLIDGSKIKGSAISTALSGAYKKAVRRHPELAADINSQLESLRLIETGPAKTAADKCFGNLLAAIFASGAGFLLQNEQYEDLPVIVKGLSALGYDLGRWIYLMDAIDDLAQDIDNGSWNPFSADPPDQAAARADKLLSEYELALDRTAALLPYRRDASLIANVIIQGLPYVREQILSGQKPGKL